ncbi:9661_t:CDS:2, partial [Ambispora gerdemannii]
LRARPIPGCEGKPGGVKPEPDRGVSPTMNHHSQDSPEPYCGSTQAFVCYDVWCHKPDFEQQTGSGKERDTLGSGMIGYLSKFSGWVPGVGLPGSPGSASSVTTN